MNPARQNGTGWPGQAARPGLLQGGPAGHKAKSILFAVLLCGLLPACVCGQTKAGGAPNNPAEMPVHCVDAATGKPYWTHEVDDEVWGSTLAADGKLYAGTHGGVLWVLAAQREKKVLARVLILKTASTAPLRQPMAHSMSPPCPSFSPSSPRPPIDRRAPILRLPPRKG